MLRELVETKSDGHLVFFLSEIIRNKEGFYPIGFAKNLIMQE